MDNFSAGTVSSPSLRKKTYQLVVQRHGLLNYDSDMSSTNSDGTEKVVGFPSESVDAFDRNHWST
jgi:hypothetical protein